MSYEWADSRNPEYQAYLDAEEELYSEHVNPVPQRIIDKLARQSMPHEVDSGYLKTVEDVEDTPDYKYTFCVSDKDDLVNHPSHYTSGDVECIDAISASMYPDEFLGYCKGNAMKYIWRYDAKDNPVQDLKKAIWYLERMIEEIESFDRELDEILNS